MVNRWLIEKHVDVDWNALTGDTIKERYESLWMVLHSVQSINGPVRYAVGGPEISSIFQTACTGWGQPSTASVWARTPISGICTLYVDPDMAGHRMKLMCQRAKVDLQLTNFFI
jgi:hypothetical protein